MLPRGCDVGVEQERRIALSYEVTFLTPRICPTFSPPTAITSCTLVVVGHICIYLYFSPPDNIHLTSIAMSTKHILLTGASRGIGLAIARFLLKDSHKVFLVARTAAPMEALKKEFPGQVEFLAADLGDFEVCGICILGLMLRQSCFHTLFGPMRGSRQSRFPLNACRK